MSPAPPGREPAVPGWSGLLPVDKPTGMTSHDVVAFARRRLRERGIGHLGTLDPNASGLLVLALGVATRCAMVWQGGRKTYAGRARFGVVTDTQDTQGAVLATSPARPDEAAVRASAAALTGELLQVPPMVSALKKDGERLYAIARRGETVEREPRAIRVDAWRWSAFTPDEAEFEVDCSGGTYVRTLVHDLGERLGCGAALSALRRLASLPFRVDAACPWSELAEGAAPEVLARYGVPLDRALESLPAVVLDDAGLEAVGRGQAPAAVGDPALVGAGPRSVVLRSAAGRALALGELALERGLVRARPNVVFPWAVRQGKVA